MDNSNQISLSLSISDDCLFVQAQTCIALLCSVPAITQTIFEEIGNVYNFRNFGMINGKVKELLSSIIQLCIIL